MTSCAGQITKKYLGVIFDDKLCWANHIDNLSNQLARCSGLFCRLRNYVREKLFACSIIT